MADTEVVAEAPKGLDAILSSAIEGANLDGGAAPVVAEPSPEPRLDQTGRAHGADGKFVTKEPAKAEAPDGLAPADAKTAVPAVADPPKVELVEPHPRWPAELKAEFAKWPPEVQKSFRARDDATEAEYTRKSQEVAEQRKSHEPLFAEVQRQAPFFQQIGYTPEKFLAESALVAQRLMTGSPQQKGEALAYLAQLHQVPAEALLTSLGVSLTPGDDGRVTPQVNQETQQLRQQIFTLQRAVEQQQQNQVQNERTRAQAEFEAIGQTKDDSGQLKYPHFDRVKQTMVQLVAHGISQTWDQAYATAVRSDDDLYQKEMETQRLRVAEKAEQDRQAAVAKANNARSVKTSGSAPGGGAQLKGLDAHIAAAMERFAG